MKFQVRINTTLLSVIVKQIAVTFSMISDLFDVFVNHKSIFS